MAPLIVCIDGLIGAGKSTLMKQLANHYKCFPEPVTEWTLLPYYYEDFKLYGSIFQLQILASQIVQRKCFPSHGLILIERSPWTSRNVFVPLLLDDDSLSTYDKFYRTFNYEIDYFIYLDVDPPEAFRRIQNRSPIDKLISLQYLYDLHKSYISNLLVGRSNVFVVESGSAEDMEKGVRNILTKISTLSK